MIKKLLATTILLGTITISANADCVRLSNGGGCSNMNIEKLLVSGEGTYIGVSLSGNVKTMMEEQCSNSNKYILLKKSHPNYEIMHETLMEAKRSNKKVYFRVISDENKKCNLSYMELK